MIMDHYEIKLNITSNIPSISALNMVKYVIAVISHFF